MRKPYLWITFLLLVALLCAGVGWTQYVERSARQGVEIHTELLPPWEWGFGPDRLQVQVPAAIPLPAGDPRGIALVSKDFSRRVGFLKVRERRWVPPSTR